MAQTPIEQTAADIIDFSRKCSQKHLKRNVQIEDIPPDDIDVLCSYFPIQLICAVFGGEVKVIEKAHLGRMVEKAAEAANKKIMDEAMRDDKYEPLEPAGIANWQYAERIKQKVFRSLETVLNQGAGTTGHNQYVQAAKALLDQAEKTKSDAAEIMKAYETQLLILADFFVEKFLTKLGALLKKDIHKGQDEVIRKIEEIAKPDKFSVSIWGSEIKRMIRAFELKRFELLLAETMANDPKVSAAFDFTKDLVENYKETSHINVDDKHQAILKQHINARG